MQPGMKAETKVEVTPPWWMRLLVGRRPKRTLVRLVVLTVTSFVVSRWILLPVRIQGISMEPNYHDGRINFVNRLAYCFHPPRRGDVVFIRLAGPHVMLLKRIVGLPGERVAFRNGRVLVNGEFIAEPYVKKPRAPWGENEVTLEPQKYFYVGDNREMPEQLHTHGKVDEERIMGKVLF
jgi:signal peptidase I